MPILTPSSLPRLAWHDASDDFWGHPRRPMERAWKANVGPVTLTVWRNAVGRWGCRCPLWPSVELEARNEVEAQELAVSKLAEAVGEVLEALR